MGMDYKSAGVDVEAGYKSVELIKRHVQGTYTKDVLNDLGSFSGLFSLSAARDMKEPVLVSGTDGVGTKLKIAFLMDKHDTVGIDCVAMCVNDIVCCGARPLFFLDYIACGKNYPEKIEQIVKGISAGCKESGAALIGGETAEMPGFYPVDEYDLAGFCVGILDKADIIDGKTISDGDTLIGIESSGLHSNGYSLVRKVFDISKENISKYYDELGCTLGEELLKPTRIYAKTVLELISKVKIKGISNITGGGFIENIPRMLPEGVCAFINEGTWEIPPIFNLIADQGNVSKDVMYNTLNMGISLVMAVSKEDAEETLSVLKSLDEKAYIIGEVRKDDSRRIEICYR